MWIYKKKTGNLEFTKLSPSWLCLEIMSFKMRKKTTKFVTSQNLSRAEGQPRTRLTYWEHSTDTALTPVIQGGTQSICRLNHQTPIIPSSILARLGPVFHNKNHISIVPAEICGLTTSRSLLSGIPAGNSFPWKAEHCCTLIIGPFSLKMGNHTHFCKSKDTAPKPTQNWRGLSMKTAQQYQDLSAHSTQVPNHYRALWLTQGPPRDDRGFPTETSDDLMHRGHVSRVQFSSSKCSYIVKDSISLVLGMAWASPWHM